MKQNLDDIADGPGGHCVHRTVVEPAERGAFGAGVWQTTIEDHRAVDGTLRPLPLVVWYP